MNDKDKIKEQLINEVTELRQRIVELERAKNEYKQAGEALKEREENFKALAENAAEGIAIVTHEETLVYVNRKAAEITGYSVDEIPHVRIRDLFPPDEYKELSKRFKKRLAGEAIPSQYETEIIRKDGTPVPLETSIAFTTWHGELARIVFFRDITERRRAEEALRSFQSDLQEKKDSLELLNAIADKVYGSLDLQTVAEQAVASMMNYSQSPFVGIFAVNEEARCLEALYSIGFTEEVRQEITRVPLKGSLSGITVARKDIVTSENITHDDRIEPDIKEGLLKQGFKGIISVPLLFQDRVLGVINLFFKEQIPILTDLERKTLINIGKTIGLAMANAQQVAQIRAEITERKRAEELLQREREVFYSTLQEAPNGVALIDKDGRYLYINSAFTTITGYTLEDIPTGRDWFRKAYPNQQYRHTFIELWKNDLSRKVFDRVSSVVCKDGAVKEIEFRGTVLEDGRAIIMLSDITERVRTEDELRESEIRYKTLFDCAADAIFVHDLRGKFLDVNIVACERYGYSKEEFLQMTPQDIMTPERVKNMLQRVDEIRTQGYFLYETVHVRRDGTMIPTEVSSQIIEYHGRPVVLSIARDITERKQAEKALRESEERFRLLVDNSKDGLVLHDFDGRILDVNQHACESLGYTREELLGLSVQDIDENFIPGKHKEKWEQMVPGVPITIGGLHRRKDGTTFPTEVRLGVLESGGRRLLLGLVRDITERKQAEEALRESEDKYRSVVERANDGITIIQNMMFKYVNPRLAEIRGEPVEQITGKSFTDYIDPDELPKVVDRYNRRMKGEDVPPIYETVLRRKDGSKIYVELNAGIITYQNELADLVLVRDITERKEIEKTLRESEQRFRILVEHSKDAFILHDFDGRILDVNQHACESLGYTREELLGLSVQDIDENFIPGKHKEKWEQMVPGVPITIGGLHRRKDGTTFPTEVRLGVLESGGRRLLLGLVRDITERKQAEEALRESQKELQTIMDASPIAISWADMHGNIQYINRKHYELFGYTLEEIPTIDEWRRQADQDPSQRERFANWGGELTEAHKDGRSLPPREMTVTCKDGSIRHVTIEGAIVSNRNLVTYNDITVRRQMEEVLRASEEKYRSLVEFTEDAVYLVNRQKQYLFMNGKYLSRLGLPRTHIIGRHYGEFHSREDDEEFSKRIEQVFATSRFVQYEHRSQRDGRYFLRTLSPVKEPDGNIEAITVISKDITERKRAEEKLTYMATHDSLTGLPNRMLFNDRLTLALAQAHHHKKKLAVMLLDMDYFKDVNDSLGHSVGDQLLRAVGNRLRALLRRGDAVARVGGDEFLMLLSEIARLEDANIIAQKILEAFRKPFVVDDHELSITASIGVAIYPNDGDDADTLMKHADIAMYRAKDKGRSIYQRYAAQLK